LNECIGEGFGHPPANLRLQALATGLQQLHRGQVVAARRRISEPADVEGGHSTDVGDPVLLDELEHIGRLGARPDDDACAGHEEALHAGTSERHVVRKGQHADLAAIGGDVLDGCRGS